MKKTLLIALLALNTLFGLAQVGINTLSPNDYSVLHINSENEKGVLFPTMTESFMAGIAATNPPYHGLFAYNKESASFYYKDNATLFRIFGANVSTSPPSLSYGNCKLLFSEGSNTLEIRSDLIELKGASSSNLKIESTGITTTGNITATGFGNINAATVTATGNVAAATVTATGDITATSSGKFVGYGTVPIGGIIMWSGVVATYFDCMYEKCTGKAGTIMDGWVLCAGGTIEGLSIPDLRGRFVVGYGNYYTSATDAEGTAIWDNDYGTIGAKNKGQRVHKLSRYEIPKHKHIIDNGSDGATQTASTFLTNVTARTEDRDGKGSTDPNPVMDIALTSEAHTHTGYTGDGTSGDFGGLTSDTNGKADAHENRPPYYVIAFIMRYK
jgi:microcystin-dependent protein